MANQDLNINLNVNPLGQPNETSAMPVETSTVGVNLNEKEVSIKNLASIGLVANAGKQIFMSTLGQIGAITGDMQAQRRINKGLTLVGFGLGFAINPLVGTLNVLTTLASDAIQASIEVRNENIGATYFRRQRGSRSNKGRVR